MNHKFLVKRLNEISVKFKLSYSKVEENSGFGGSSITKWEFKELIFFREGIRMLNSLELFSEGISFFWKSFVFQTSSNSFRVNYNIGEHFIDQYEFFIKMFRILHNELSRLVPKEKEHSVLIKLSKISDFDDLAKNSKKINDILSQTILRPEIDGKIEITSVGNGSIWIEVCLGSLAAVKLLSSLFQTGASIYKEIQKARIMEKNIEALGIKNESLTEIKEAQKKLIKQLIDAESIQLTKKFYQKEEQEQILRVKNSIEIISELIQKGSELHPSINAPEEVTKLFPDFKELESVSSKMALLNIRNAQEDKNK
ncbi:hypothetical protein [Aureispira anguillae]|uniref:Uncharacterized protein n=1 Tax=Aureispira anguillae TaxID=2864201 RepID=A0A916DUB5_9BACT|nr:hypothetical protein [Aureispira anguillae]BDS13191.1 hypothetical protein AsAng_0039190 [Aureispira anguillae]